MAGQTPNDQALFQVFGPSAPVKGEIPSTERSLIGPGNFQLLKNLRSDTGIPIARLKDVSVLTKPSWASTATPLGKLEVSLNGQAYVIAAFQDGSATRIAVAPSTLDRWIEVTGTGQWTGASGNNRLTGTASQCYFTVFKTPRFQTTSGTFSSRDCVLIQNGVDDPRIWDPDTTNIPNTETISNVTSNSGLIRVTMSSHNIQTGDHIYITGVNGVSAANGLWQVTRISSTVVDLQGSVFSGSYTSGGTVSEKIDLLVHKPIVEPGTLFHSYATCGSFWQVAGGSGKTYASGGVLNQSRYKLANSSAAPYDGTNANITWTTDTAVAANDIATVQFSAGISLGRQFVWFVEGKWVLENLKSAKIEVNPENVAYGSIVQPWVTVYDGTGATDDQRGVFEIIPYDSTSNQYWIVFDTGMIESTGAYHLRFTRQSSSQPGATTTMSIIFMGSPDGDIPASSLWGGAYEDEANKVEQRFHTMVAGADHIGLLGGSQFVRNGTGTDTKEAPSYPLSASVNADWRFTFPNSNQTGSSSSISGGLNGVAERINLYVKLPTEEQYHWLTGPVMYTAGYSGATRVWLNSETDLIAAYDLPNGVTQLYINSNREAPSAFQMPIPIGTANLFRNNRLFVGAVKDASSQFGYSDAYGSWERYPFRFQQVQEDDFRGFYLHVSGERIQCFSASASAALGAGRIYMFTDRNLYVLGDSGPYATAGFTASDLSRPYSLGPHGTLSPLSVTQGYSAMFWVDQNMQAMRLGSGVPVNIGRNTISTKLETSVSTRRGNISGCFFKDRWILAFTATGETLNEQTLVWNERMQAWESEDFETNSLNFEQFGIYDAVQGSVATPRVFFFDSAGTLFAYEESSSGTIAVRWITGAFQFKGWDGWFIEENAISATAVAATTVSIGRISRTWGADEPWTTTLSLAKTGADYARGKDNYIPVKTGTARGTQEDFEWYLDCTATVPPGTVFLRHEFGVKGITASMWQR